MYLKLKTFLTILNKKNINKGYEKKSKNEYENIKTNTKIINTNNIPIDKYQEFINELELYNMYQLV